MPSGGEARLSGRQTPPGTMTMVVGNLRPLRLHHHPKLRQQELRRKGLTSNLKQSQKVNENVSLHSIVFSSSLFLPDVPGSCPASATPTGSLPSVNTSFPLAGSLLLSCGGEGRLLSWRMPVGAEEFRLQAALSTSQGSAAAASSGGSGAGSGGDRWSKGPSSSGGFGASKPDDVSAGKWVCNAVCTRRWCGAGTSTSVMQVWGSCRVFITILTIH